MLSGGRDGEEQGGDGGFGRRSPPPLAMLRSPPAGRRWGMIEGNELGASLLAASFPPLSPARKIRGALFLLEPQKDEQASSSRRRESLLTLSCLVFD